jgi:hypothetical protein
MDAASVDAGKLWLNSPIERLGRRHRIAARAPEFSAGTMDHIAENPLAAQEEIVGNVPAWNGHEPLKLVMPRAITAGPRQAVPEAPRGCSYETQSLYNFAPRQSKPLGKSVAESSSHRAGCKCLVIAEARSFGAHMHVPVDRRGDHKLPGRVNLSPAVKAAAGRGNRLAPDRNIADKIGAARRDAPILDH